MNGADLIVHKLREYGVEWLATLCGHGLDPLFRAARDGGIRLVDTRNEQTASYIAEAYGRLTRWPGVCAVSSGVAHVNALTGVANAWFDHGPMLLISGAASTATAGKGDFQEMDQTAVAQPLCKIARRVLTAEDLGPALDEAFQLAVTQPRGPVHLTFPLDVQNSAAPGTLAPSASPVSVSSVQDVQSIASALKSSKQPLVIAGSDVFYSCDAAGMIAFCEHHRIPVMTPIWDRGPVKQVSSVFVGILGAATGGPAILGDADCILMAGAESDYRTGYLEPPAVRTDARVLHFRGDWNQIEQACKEQDVLAHDDWLGKCQERRNQFRDSVEARGEDQARAGLHAIHVIRAIESVLDTDPILLVDGGSIGQWAHQLLCSNRYPPDWLTCGRSGVVGWGIGGAMAARLAFPSRPVILLSGDGAFTFNIADIESAARQELPFVAIVVDDQGWGITRAGHMRQFGMPIASSLGPIAFADVATALGARGVRADTPDAIRHELRVALQQPAVTVIHVPVVGGNPA